MSRGLFGRKKERPQVDGLYLWGGVGRGKTYLMDCFFDALPFEEKTRLHFHRFMQKVHDARKRYANQSDPLKKIAADWAADRVLCFDEFFVSDIADAMILSRLTEELFARNVTLVATSNVDPDDLYKGGLKRDRFLPAIERLKNNCRIMHLADGTDFRLDHIEESATYQMPPGDEADGSARPLFRAPGHRPDPRGRQRQDPRAANCLPANGRTPRPGSTSTPSAARRARPTTTSNWRANSA